MRPVVPERPAGRGHFVLGLLRDNSPPGRPLWSMSIALLLFALAAGLIVGALAATLAAKRHLGLGARAVAFGFGAGVAFGLTLVSSVMLDRPDPPRTTATAAAPAVSAPPSPPPDPARLRAVAPATDPLSGQDGFSIS